MRENSAIQKGGQWLVQTKLQSSEFGYGMAGLPLPNGERVGVRGI